MPDCCRIEEYELTIHGNELRGLIVTAWCAANIDFGTILGDAFPNFIRMDRERIGLPDPEIRMTFSIPAIGEATAWVERLLRIARWTVTIKDTADESHSIFLHDLPAPNMDNPTAPTNWEYSRVGKLVRAAKSYGPGSGSLASARDLCDKYLLRWIRQHVRYRRANTIIPAPPSNSDKSFDLPYFLAKRLSDHLGMSLTLAESLRATEQQKNVGVQIGDLHSNVAGKCSIPADLRGQTVIALDDIYGSGATMADLVRAARAAGAQTVLSLTATKTATHTTNCTPSYWYRISHEAAQHDFGLSDA